MNMENVKVYYIKPKFWPDRENRKRPDSSCLLADEPAITDIFRYRQEVRLYYRNWIEVWRTYSYFNMYTPLLIPVAGLLLHSWIAAVAVAALWIGWARIIGYYKYRLWSLKILIPGLFDRMISEQYGELLPFED